MMRAMSAAIESLRFVRFAQGVTIVYAAVSVWRSFVSVRDARPGRVDNHCWDSSRRKGIAALDDDPYRRRRHQHTERPEVLEFGDTRREWIRQGSGYAEWSVT